MKRLLEFVSVILFMLPTHAFSQKLIQYISMNSPIAVAVNPVTNMIYAANYTGNTVGVIDGNTNAVVATIPVGAGPFSLAVNPVTNLVYVSNSGAPQGTGMSVMVIDGSSNTVAATVPLIAYPGFIAVNPTTNLVYFTIEEGPPIDVAVMDGATYKIIATIPVTQTCCQEGLALNSVTNRLYLSIDPFSGPSYMAVIDTTTNKLSGKFTPPGLKFAGPVAVDTGLNRLYTSDGAGGGVFVINGVNNGLIAVLPYFAESFAVNQTTHVFAMVYDELTFVNGLTDEIVGGQVPFPVGTWRINLAAGIDNHFYGGYDNTKNNVIGAVGVYSGPPSQ